MKIKILPLILIVFVVLISFNFYLGFSPFAYGVSPVEYDEKIGMWHKKNYSAYQIKECYKNKFSFDEKGLSKSLYKYDPVKKDVIVLGDSHVQALRMKNESVIHNALATEYDQKYNFLNYGLAGTSPVQHYVILKEKADLKNAKYVLQFVNMGNDLWEAEQRNLDFLSRPKVYVEFEALNDFEIIPPRKKNIYDEIIDVMSGFEIYYFFKKSIYFVKDSFKKSDYKSRRLERAEKSRNRDFSKNWLYIKGSIYQIDKYIKSLSADIEYRVVVDSEYKENRRNGAKLTEFLKSINVEFLFLDEYVESGKLKIEGYPCDHHWNASTVSNMSKLIKEVGLIN
jgi:hypothetical protein